MSGMARCHPFYEIFYRILPRPPGILIISFHFTLFYFHHPRTKNIENIIRLYIAMRVNIRRYVE